MNDPDLNPAEARATVRRHAHDLRNMINCIDLEITCLLEETPGTDAQSPLHRMREQLALTERLIFSLSVRFREPSLHPAAAVDIYYNWRQQIHKLGQGARFQWDDPVCTAAIHADFTAVIAVLVEICLHAKTPAGAPLPVASLSSEGTDVVFSVHEPPAEMRFPVDVQQRKEWERLAEISGGRLEVTGEDETGPHTTRLIFPSVPATPS